jgi:hypothetical protein
MIPIALGHNLKRKNNAFIAVLYLNNERNSYSKTSVKTAKYIGMETAMYIGVETAMYIGVGSLYIGVGSLYVDT